MPKITKIIVNLGRRNLLAYSGQDLAYDFDCVIGREGHETLPGLFHIFRRELMHYSHAYGNTPMPYSMFFSHDGKAIHGTPAAKLRSYAGWLGFGGAIPVVGSHGCVGLSEDDAKVLFDATPLHTLVQIL